MRLRILAAASASGLALVAGCADTNDPVGPGPKGSAEVQASFTGLPESSTYLGHLELWISFAEVRAPGLRHATNASAGKFKINNGQIVGLDYQPMTFAVDVTDPDVPVNPDGTPVWQLAVDTFVTIEPEDDAFPDEPNSAFLGGAFLNGSATLSIDDGDAVGFAFASIGGSFVLATPTTQTAADETEGIWFAAPGGTGPSLTLPVLPNGTDWVYEGWVSAGAAKAASLGRFRDAAAADLDAGGPLAGVPPSDAPGYAYPGSDFPFGTPGSLDFASAGGDVNVFVTLEPAIDPDPKAPFFLDLLTAPVPAGVSASVSIPLLDQTVGFPTGTVTIPSGS